MSYMRAGRPMGLGAVDCGPTPCGFFDLFPIPGPFTSSKCAAWLTCKTTGTTPTPADIPTLRSIVSAAGGEATPDSSPGANIQDQQAACAEAGGTWDPVNSLCKTPTDLSWLPWALGGAAVLLVGGFVLGGRR